MKNKNFTKLPLLDTAKYQAVGCELSAGPRADIFSMIFIHTSGDVCTTGCAWFNNGKCAAYTKLLQA